MEESKIIEEKRFIKAERERIQKWERVEPVLRYFHKYFPDEYEMYTSELDPYAEFMADVINPNILTVQSPVPLS